MLAVVFGPVLMHLFCFKNKISLSLSSQKIKILTCSRTDKIHRPSSVRSQKHYCCFDTESLKQGWLPILDPPCLSLLDVEMEDICQYLLLIFYSFKIYSLSPLCVCLCVSVWGYVHKSACACRSQRCWTLLELELQTFIRLQKWVLRNELE